MFEEGLDDATLEEFNTLISGTVIPTLIKIADKYNYDRDSMIKFTADTMVAMAEVATFRNYEYEKDSGSSSEKPNKWIPVKWHEITDEEREREGYPKDWVCHLDSIMPYDGQRILITTKGGFVELDECYSDDGCTFSLDSGYDWVDDVIAWMPLPEPYKQEVKG